MAEYKYLDSAGVQYLWGKIKSTFESQSDAEAALALKANAADVYKKTETYSKGEVDNAINAAKYDDTTLKASVDANTAALGVLNGSGAGSVSKTVSDAIKEWAEAVTGDNQTIDTFKEIVDWVASHGKEAADIVSDLEELQTALAALGEDTLADYIEGVIDDLNLDQYALAEDLDDLATKAELKALEDGQVKTNKEAIAGLTSSVGTNTSDIADLKSKANKASTDISGLQESVGELESSVGQNTSDITSLQSQVEALEQANGETNVIEKITVNGAAVSVDSSTKTAAIVVDTTKALTTDEIDAAVEAAEEA